MHELTQRPSFCVVADEGLARVPYTLRQQAGLRKTSLAERKWSKMTFRTNYGFYSDSGYILLKVIELLPDEI